MIVDIQLSQTPNLIISSENTYSTKQPAVDQELFILVPPNCRLTTTPSPRYRGRKSKKAGMKCQSDRLEKALKSQKA